MSKEKPKKLFNYRVILDKDVNGHPFYSIRGVHYTDHGETIEGWDANPLTLIFDQGDSISGYLNQLEQAAVKPVLGIAGDTLIELSQKTAEMFISQSSKYPAFTPQETVDKK